jgi:hypothetical protein
MDTAAAKLEALIAAWRVDPVRFAPEALGVEPREDQPAVLRGYAEHDRVAWSACRNAGKTMTTVIAAYHFLICEPGSAVFVNTPTTRQSDYWMTTAARVHRAAPARELLFPDWQVLASEIRTTLPGWRLLATSAESGPAWIEGFHSARNVLLILDEARSIPDAVIDSCHQILGGHEVAKILMTSTPGRPQGKFYAAFSKDAARWRTITTSAADIPRLRAHYEEQRAEHAGDAFFQQQLEGRFADVEEGDGLFPVSPVRAACAQSAIAPPDDWVDCWTRMVAPPPTYRRILGVDVGGRGGDATVAAFRRGPNIESLHVLGRGQDEMTTVGLLVQLIERTRAQTVCLDVAGLGSPVASRLREVLAGPFRREVDVAEFNAGWRSNEPEVYANAKAEICFELRRRLLAGRIVLPPDSELISQLTGFSWEINSRGQKRVIDPPSASPDKADAVLIALAADTFGGPGVRSIRVRGL